MCEIEIVTGCFLILTDTYIGYTHTHSSLGLCFFLFLSLETYTFPNKVNKTENTPPTENKKRMKTKSEILANRIYFVIKSYQLQLLMLSFCPWLRVSVTVSFFFFLRLRNSFGTFGPQLEHLFNTPSLEVNPPVIPL